MEDSHLTRESLNALAYARLCRDLKAGRFVPGEKLKLRNLAEEMGISPTPVREALARLISEQALEQVGHHSVRVPVMTQDRFCEVRDLRLTLEGQAAARAAERVSVEDVTRLEAAHEQLVALREQGASAALLMETERLHMDLYRLACMPVLLRMVEGLWLQCGPLMNALNTHPMSKPRKQHPHYLLLRGLRRNDAEMARQAIHEEIERTAEPILAYLSERAAEPEAAVAVRERSSRPAV